MIKAVVLDIDGTLTDDVSWLKITELLGANVDQHRQIFEQFSDDKLSYVDAKKQLLDLWQATGNANKQFMTNAVLEWSLKSGAHELVEALKERDFKVVLMSGSFDIFVESIAQKLEVDEYYFNTDLVWDSREKLIDFNYEKNQTAKKNQQFRKFLAEHNLAAEDCVVVGDGESEVDMFKATGQGVAVGDADKKLVRASWKRAASLKEVNQIIQSLGVVALLSLQLMWVN